MSSRALCVVILAVSILLVACPKTTPKTATPTQTARFTGDPAAAAPICVRRILQAAEGREPTALLPAPRVSPKTGIIGTRVTVSGAGVRPNSIVAVIGAFAEDNCEIAGVLGATNLAGTTADRSGKYVSTFDWSPEFSSDLYPSASGVRTRPGRYYILVFQCGDPSCTPPLSEGSFPAGPFLMMPRLPAVPARTPECVKAHLRVTNDEPISEATGQHTSRFVVKNVSDRACVLDGYPTITLLDAKGHSIPFVYRDGGDQMLTSTRPSRVGLLPGESAYFAINKYRCDAGDRNTAATIRITLPGQTSAFVLDSGAGYCGPGDPGSLIDISPIEPTALAEMSG